MQKLCFKCGMWYCFSLIPHPPLKIFRSRYLFTCICSNLYWKNVFCKISVKNNWCNILKFISSSPIVAHCFKNVIEFDFQRTWPGRITCSEDLVSQDQDGTQSDVNTRGAFHERVPMTTSMPQSTRRASSSICTKLLPINKNRTQSPAMTSPGQGCGTQLWQRNTNSPTNTGLMPKFLEIMGGGVHMRYPFALAGEKQV